VGGAALGHGYVEHAASSVRIGSAGSPPPLGTNRCWREPAASLDAQRIAAPGRPDLLARATPRRLPCPVAMHSRDISLPRSPAENPHPFVDPAELRLTDRPSPGRPARAVTLQRTHFPFRSVTEGVTRNRKKRHASVMAASQNGRARCAEDRDCRRSGEASRRASRGTAKASRRRHGDITERPSSP